MEAQWRAMGWSISSYIFPLCHYYAGESRQMPQIVRTWAKSFQTSLLSLETTGTSLSCVAVKEMTLFLMLCLMQMWTEGWHFASLEHANLNLFSIVISPLCMKPLSRPFKFFYFSTTSIFQACFLFTLLAGFSALHRETQLLDGLMYSFMLWM